jgi:cell division protein FtsW
MIGDVSLLEAERSFGDRLYFIKHHLFWVFIGTIAMIASSAFDYKLFSKFSFYLYIASIALLIAVLIPGIGVTVYGAQRWINLGFTRFQPSEIAKIFLLIYLSCLLSKKTVNIGQLFLILVPPVGLTLAQPDFATAAIMVALGLIVYFFSGEEIKKIVIPSLIFLILGIFFITTSPYRRERVSGLLNPFYDPLGKSYHSHQLTLTLGSGGIWGVGMGKSRQKYLYLPQVTTDSIMAVVAEEFGLVGISMFLTIFSLFVATIIKIAVTAKEELGKILAGSIGCWIGLQGLINLSAVSVLIPLTGVTFPFISYGGSSLVSIMIAMGIVLNINKQTNEK